MHSIHRVVGRIVGIKSVDCGIINAGLWITIKLQLDKITYISHKYFRVGAKKHSELHLPYLYSKKAQSLNSELSANTGRHNDIRTDLRSPHFIKILYHLWLHMIDNRELLHKSQLDTQIVT